VAICINCKKDKNKLIFRICEECHKQINKDRFKDFDFEKEFGAIYPRDRIKNRFDILDLRGY